MNEQNHIIQKLSVEVNVPDLAMARRIHNNIGTFLQDKVLPAVEIQINELIKKEEYYRLENLSVDMSFDNENDLENLLPAALTSALIKQAVESSQKNVVDKSKNISNQGLGTGSETTVFEKKTEEEKAWEPFIGFLQTGRLPWYSSAHVFMEEKQLLNFLQNNNKERSGLKNILTDQSSATDRLVKQFSHDFIFQLAEIVFGISIVDYWKRIKQIIHAAEIQNKNLIGNRIISRLFTIITENNLQNISAEQRLESYIKEISTRPVDTKSSIQVSDIKRIKPEKRKKQFSTEVESGIYVQNAGLVLLHPFLLYFFKEFELLDDAESFKDVETRDTAIHLLHYLATAKEQSFEYDLLMEKFLCGLDLDEPVERFVILTEKMKNECTHLLEAVIHHWKVLKNTSYDGLREGFLQRNGKLSLTAYQHRLVVESGTIDILLNQLPWNYSIIQLPWMQQVFYVDWLTN